MFGFSKLFVLILFVTLVIAFGFRDTTPIYITAAKVLGGYIIIKIIWNILTIKRK